MATILTVGALEEEIETDEAELLMARSSLVAFPHHSDCTTEYTGPRCAQELEGCAVSMSLAAHEGEKIKNGT